MEREDLLVGGILASSLGLLAYSLVKPVYALPLSARVSDFKVKAIMGRTTTRRSTGEEATDFWIYPILIITGDVNGDYTITWRYTNNLGGNIYESGDITNTVTLTAGVPTEVWLKDTRPEADPTRGQSIAIGDVDFIALGIQDGNWYLFTSDVSGVVTSPTGATASFSGTFSDEFKSIGELSVSLSRFGVVMAGD